MGQHSISILVHMTYIPTPYLHSYLLTLQGKRNLLFTDNLLYFVLSYFGGELVFGQQTTNNTLRVLVFPQK